MIVSGHNGTPHIEIIYPKIVSDSSATFYTLYRKQETVLKSLTSFWVLLGESLIVISPTALTETLTHKAERGTTQVLHSRER